MITEEGVMFHVKHNSFFCIFLIYLLTGIHSIRHSVLQNAQHIVVKIHQYLDFLLFFSGNNGKIRDRIVIRSVIIFFQSLGSAFDPIACNRIMCVGSDYLNINKRNLMRTGAPCSAFYYINLQDIVFICILIFYFNIH